MTDAPGRPASASRTAAGHAGGKKGPKKTPQTRQISAPRVSSVLAAVVPFAPRPGGRAGGRGAGPLTELAFGLLSGGGRPALSGVVLAPGRERTRSRALPCG